MRDRVARSRVGAGRRATGERWRAWSFVLLLGVLLPASPTLVNLGAARSGFAPDGHPRWLGDRYLVSSTDGVRVADDPTGVASVVATLAGWGGRTVDVPANAGPVSLEAALADAFDRAGYRGTWSSAGAVGVGDGALPVVAIVDAAADPTPVIVRRVIGGHVYAFDPRVGTVLYRPRDWRQASSGSVFRFDRPPPAPRAWR